MVNRLVWKANVTNIEDQKTEIVVFNLSGTTLQLKRATRKAIKEEAAGKPIETLSRIQLTTCTFQLALRRSGVTTSGTLAR